MGQVSAQEAIALLDHLIATPSHSREEKATGDLIEAFLRAQGIDVQFYFSARHLALLYSSMYLWASFTLSNQRH